MKNKSIVREYLKEIIFGALIIVLGILFCIYKNTIMDTLEIIFIVISIVYGTLVLVLYFGFDRNENDIFSVIQAVLYVIFGFLTLLINNFFLYAIALSLAILGIRYVVMVAKQKGKLQASKFLLVFGILSIILSLLIFITCIFSLRMDYLMIIIGCSLIVIGLLYTAMSCLLIRIETIIQNENQ